MSRMAFRTLLRNDKIVDNLLDVQSATLEIFLLPIKISPINTPFVDDIVGRK
jgi:hypothetical protein